MRSGRLCEASAVVVVSLLLVISCSVTKSSGVKLSCWPEEVALEQQVGLSRAIIEMAPAGETQQATFAAGCFWSVELAFQRVPGVVKSSVGYTQGHTANPTYEQVCGGRTGHAEAVLVEYNPSELSYEQLLDVFWKKHDPTQHNRQGNDVGTQYRSGIYYHTPEQESASTASLKAMESKLGKKIATEVLPAKTFYPAEDYHQQYLEKGGRGGRKQSARKGCSDPIRCYG